METNPRFLQLTLCWKSYFKPHAHVVGKLFNGQPYRILMPSQNCCLFKSKPYSFSGYAFNQFEILSRAPFRLIVFVLRLIFVRFDLACFYGRALFHILLCLLFYFYLKYRHCMTNLDC